MKILVIEAAKKEASSIKRGLEDCEYQVTAVFDGVEGLKQALTGEYSLVILDVMLPKKDGLTVMKELREAGNQVPVLMLTARGATEDIVTGLKAGADDYLAKPFAFAELLARVKALARRSKRDRGAKIYFADLQLDPVSHKVWRGRTELDLTGREYVLMAYLIQNPNIVLSRKMIAENVWKEKFNDVTNIIDVYINYLRKKVDVGYPTKLIRTIRGQGFALTNK